MKFKDGINDSRTARTINEEAYSVAAIALHNKTPGSSQVPMTPVNERHCTRLFSEHKHPDREEFRLCCGVNSEKYLPFVRASHRAGWKTGTDTTEDDWRPKIIKHKGVAKRIKRADLRSLATLQADSIIQILTDESARLVGIGRRMPAGLPVKTIPFLSDHHSLLVFEDGQVVLFDSLDNTKAVILKSDVAAMRLSIATAYDSNLDRFSAKLVNETRPEFIDN